MSNYQKAQANGESFSLPTNGVGKSVETIAAATTLTAEDSGKEFILTAAGGAAITLPAPMSGWNAKFRVGSTFASTNWTIVSATDVIEGYAAVNYATIAAANENTISLVAAKAIVGDWVELVSDGTSFYVSGAASVTVALTFTAP